MERRVARSLCRWASASSPRTATQRSDEPVYAWSNSFVELNPARLPLNEFIPPGFAAKLESKRGKTHKVAFVILHFRVGVSNWRRKWGNRSTSSTGDAVGHPIAVGDAAEAATPAPPPFSRRKRMERANPRNSRIRSTSTSSTRNWASPSIRKGLPRSAGSSTCSR